MKSVAALLAVLGSAAAFAPAQQSQSSSALAAKAFSDALGAQAPVSSHTLCVAGGIVVFHFLRSAECIF
jgi:hypothetical protein